MPPKKVKVSIEKPVEILEVLEETVPSDDEIEIPAPTPKPKRVLTEKQKEALAKGRAVCHARTMLKDLKEEKTVKKAEVMSKAKKEIEDSIIKTAVKLKKKQLVVEAKLNKYVDDGDEDEIPDEVIKKIIKRKTVAKPIQYYEPEPEPQQSLYYFL